MKTLDYCKSIAKAFLETEPNLEFGGMIVQHPFYQPTFILSEKNSKGETEHNIYQIDNLEKRELHHKIILERIDSAKNLLDIIIIMNSPYYMNYLSVVFIFFDEDEYKEFADVFMHCWTSQEFPNWCGQDYLEKIAEIFKTCKNYLMTEEDLKVYNDLPDKVKIYRGTASLYNYYPAMSWTLSKEKAEWFANRFNKEGIVWDIEINKEDILCYNNTRNEQEIIIEAPLNIEGFPAFRKELYKKESN